MSGRDLFKKHKKTILFLSRIISKKTLKKRYKILEKYSKNNDAFSILIRYIIVKATAKKCGDNVYIAKNVVLKNIEYMELGDNISIHEFSYVDGGRGLSIGNNVSIAHNCSIIAANHQFEPGDVPFKYQDLSFKGISIGDNVWIGAKSILLAGSQINNNVVVGAGTVCTSKQILESWSVYAGNPAEFKKAIKNL